MSTEDLINIVNAVGLGVFVLLLAAAAGRLAVRYATYRLEGVRVGVILRRDVILLGALALVFGSVILIRALGWSDFVASHSEVRLAYIVASDIVALGALGYWTWAEYFVVGKPGKEKE